MHPQKSVRGSDAVATHLAPILSDALNWKVYKNEYSSPSAGNRFEYGKYRKDLRRNGQRPSFN